jgi:hypothetical protein
MQDNHNRAFDEHGSYISIAASAGHRQGYGHLAAQRKGSARFITQLVV